MSKFHINKHGVPAPCRAKQGNCPLGGDSGADNHFDSAEEAQAHVDEINRKKHEILPGVNDSEVEEAFKEEYRLATDDLGAGTIGSNYVTYTHPDYETFEDENVRKVFVDNFGEDSFVVEVGDSEDPMSYSLDATSEGSVAPYKDAIDSSAFERGVVDDNGEWTQDFKADLSEHLKSNEGEVKNVFGKKMKKALSPHDGADFVKNYKKEETAKIKSSFEESYRQATDDVEAGTVGSNFVAQTDPDYESFEDKEVQSLMIDKFGEDSFVVEVGDNEDPMSYSLDATSEGALYAYRDAMGDNDFERGIVDEDGEFTPEFRADLSKHLKENEGPVKNVFGKKLRKALDPEKGAEFLRNYNK